MKKLFRTIHLYLSLVAGIFIMIACLTGSILVFEDEINHNLYAERYFVTQQNAQLPLETLANAALSENGNSTLSSIKKYNDPLRTVEIGLSVVNKEKSANPKKGKEKGKPGLTAYVNPYTGKVIETENKKKSFFMKVEMLHRFLLDKKGGVGQYIMGYSAMFFFFILLTGLILWWPKTKAVLKQRLNIKWNAKGKRFIHDLHVVTGFYTSVFLIVIVMTGLVMSFNWINKGIFTLTGSKMENPKAPNSSLKAGMPPLNLNKLESIIHQNFGEALFYTIRFPKEKEDAYSVSVLTSGKSENAFDNYYIDQYSGEIIGNSTFADKNIGQKIRSYIKPIHTGELYGLTTKILNFIICLLTLTFPVTGIMMWLNRIKKNKSLG